MIRILRQCARELAELPEEVRADLADAVARLEQGHMLTMPLSRPMPSIGRGVHELRFRERSGIYRVFYILGRREEIVLLHATAKRTQATPFRVIQLVQKRLAEC